MQDIPFGQLLILLAFIVVPFINWLLQRMRRRFERQPPREELPRQPTPRTFAKAPPLEIIASAREPVRAPEIIEIPPRPRMELRKKTFFRNRRDLRRAIILMTVLGPCRALDAAGREPREFPPGMGR